MKVQRIELRVSEEEKALIDATAKNENLKNATFMRKVIMDYIKNKK